MTRLPFFFIATLLLGCSQQKSTPITPFDQPPAWAQEAIWYQVFVERFCNGDTTNDPTAASIEIPPIGVKAPTGWKPTPWTQNWYQPDDYARDSTKSFRHWLQFRRYGGDLAGLIQKLDYLSELGINALYLNPINHAPSLHKYDASCYHHVDAHFGPDPEGDKAIMAKENPNDPATWQWTAADKLFLELVKKAHEKGIRVILDVSWNHTGTLFWAWQDVLKNGEQSPYKDWYNITRFDDPSTPANELAYEGWLNIKSLPEIKKVNITTERRIGYPYEGNINEGAKKHMFDATRRWLAPDGNPENGIDGFRLDVADHIGLGFWRDWRKVVRSAKPDAYLVGEIWWQQWPDELMDPAPYCHGDIFDAVMFYQAYRPAKYFFSLSNYDLSAASFRDSLLFQWNRLGKSQRYAMMNVSSTHDAPRLLTCFYNPGKYKVNAIPYEDSAYKSGKPDAETYARVRLYLLHMFTSVGAPHIWNGEELGMWGGDDPDPRKPLWWPNQTIDPETRNPFLPGPKQYDSTGFNQEHFNWYKKLIDLRKKNPVLIGGNIAFVQAEEKILGYKRFNQNDSLLVYLNAGKSPASINLPAGNYTDLITGNQYTGNFPLPPISGRVFKRKS